jgi:phosphatidylserine decarboxylase
MSRRTEQEPGTTRGSSADPAAGSRTRRIGPRHVVFATAVGTLLLVAVLLRFAVVTGYLGHAAVRDPVRVSPAGPVIVAPADGTVLYVKRVEGGVVPEVVKRGVPVPIVDLVKAQPAQRFRDGYLIGIYMNTFGVHVNRIPNHGVVKRQLVFNGPHMDMTSAEVKIILTEMVPGLVTARKILGLSPHATDDDHDFVLKSARETLVVEDERGVDLYIVRIADYYVGKTLTWVRPGQSVARGQKMGMITWGSQTDLFIEETPGLEVEIEVGDYVHGGETVLASY